MPTNLDAGVKRRALRSFVFSHTPSTRHLLSLPVVLAVAAACSGQTASDPSLGTAQEALSLPLPAPSRVFGQRDLLQTSYNEVVAYRGFHPTSAFIDRSSVAGTPSHVYVWDSGNNRVLGFDNFGSCSGGTSPGVACTETSRCGAGGTCVPSATHSARFALGQPSPTGYATCNGDNTKAVAASAASLCLVPYPNQPSPMEGPTGGQMVADTAHNLYIVDNFNNRVLKYNDPFASDTTADWQWGQADFVGRGCNRGGAPSAQSLCTGDLNGGDRFYTSSVDVTPNGQTLWVADPGNRRVLKVVPGQANAQLVLGQTSFTTVDDGCDLPVTDGSRMCIPSGVAYNAATDTLYVMDGNRNSSGRILVYVHPASNGQQPSAIWQAPATGQFRWPRGLTLEPTSGALWVNDTDNNRSLRYVNGAVTHFVGHDLTLPLNDEHDAIRGPHGSVGIDKDGALYLGDILFEQIRKYPSGTVPGQAPVRDVAQLFNQVGQDNHLSSNHVGASGLANPGYVAFAGSQLVVADRNRILFYNNYSTGSLAAGAASGVLAQPSFTTQTDDSVNHGANFFSLAYDGSKQRLYATAADFITVWSTANGGLSNNAPYLEQFRPSELLTVAGQPLGCPTGLCYYTGIFVESASDVGWLTDNTSARVIRITNFSSTTNRRIDLVMGQTSLSGTGCFQGAGEMSPTAKGLCEPNQVSKDKLGNLYVAGGSWECSSSPRCRVVQYPAAGIPAPSTTLKFPNLSADRVYGQTSLTSNSCDSSQTVCSPLFVGFDPNDGSMVAAGDAYSNSLDRRLGFWANPIPVGSVAPPPTGFLNLRTNGAGNIAFDGQGRMAVLDHTWNRVMLYTLPTSTTATKTFLKTSGGYYVTAENNGGGGASTNRTAAGGWETLYVEDLNGGVLTSGDSIRVRTSTGWYASANANASGQNAGGGTGSILRFNRNTAAASETFTVAKAGGGAIVSGNKVTFKGANPYYVCAVNGGNKVGDGSLVVDRAAASTWETFTITFP